MASGTLSTARLRERSGVGQALPAATADRRLDQVEAIARTPGPLPVVKLQVPDDGLCGSSTREPMALRVPTHGTSCDCSREAGLRARYRVGMSEKLRMTIAFEGPDEGGWIVAQVVEVPGAISQGRTRSEARENVIDALRLMLSPDDGDASDETVALEVLLPA